MLEARLRKNLDYPLVAVTLAVACIGLAALYSATRDDGLRYLLKQSGCMVLGLIGMVAAARIDYALLPRLTKPLYIVNVGLLLLVMRIGSEIKGAQRWINIAGFQFQPSELAKLVMIVCLASFLVARREKIRELPTLIASFIYISVPTALIFKQPDLGTALVLVAIWFGMTFLAGARIRHLAGFVVVGLLTFTAMWHFNIMETYQKNRLIAFLNPDVDRKNVGYHVRQARIAVGSGQVTGKGFRAGTQGKGNFIPENHTDFIFTVVAEEGGFVASVVLVSVYGLLLYRGLMAASVAQDLLGKLLAGGVVSMLAFHVVLNIGMNVGIMPVAGVPLPLVSYGGTSMVLTLTSIGLLLGIGMRRHTLVF